jgi:predicted HTH transcriptional regulator
MFEIKCIIGDKKLVEVLHLLDGHTLEPPVVLPVKGTVVTAIVRHGNGHASTVAPSANSIETLSSFVGPLKRVTAKELREHLESRGFSKNGYSYALKKLVENGALKKSRSEKNTYEVIR